MTAALLVFAWLLGIAAAAFTGGDSAAILATGSLAVLVSFIVRPARSTLIVAPVAVALVALAFMHYNATIPESDQGVAYMNEQGIVRLRGVIDDVPRDLPRSRLYEVEVTDEMEIGAWRSVSGRIVVRTAVHARLSYGDMIEIEGKLESPESTGGFDYAGYLLRRGITSIAYYPKITHRGSSDGDGLKSALIDIRTEIQEALADTLPEPHASLAAGVLIGSEGVPVELRNDMAATGTSHLVAVSGQNIAMLGALVIAAFSWLIGRRPASVLALMSLTGYAVLAGSDASVVRAFVMGVIYVVATMTGRQHAAPIALVYAAAAMTVMDPQVVHSVSFQLSFAATLGLITLAPLLATHLKLAADRLPTPEALSRSAAEMLAVTLAAIAFTLPISAMNFGTISVVAPLANLFVVPAFVVVAITASITAITVLIVPEIADIVVWAAWIPVAYMLAAIRAFASLPLVAVNVDNFSIAHAVASYTAIASFTWWLSRRSTEVPTRVPPTLRLRKVAAAGGLTATIAVAAALTWMTLSHGDEPRVSVTVLDIGQGDAILIEDRAGHRVLVDGGPRGDDLALALGRHLPFYDRRIDVVVVTHPQADHLTGLLEVIDSYDVSSVIASPIDEETDLTMEWESAVAADGID
jgi:competence protein ComEC